MLTPGDITKIIEGEFDIEWRDSTNGNSVLHYAVLDDRLDIVMILLRGYNMGPDVENSAQLTPSYLVVNSNVPNIDILIALIAFGANVNALFHTRTLLDIALTKNKSIELIVTLLACGIRMDVMTGISKIYPLYRAAMAGNLPALVSMLQLEADVNAKSDNGLTAIHAVAKFADKDNPIFFSVVGILYLIKHAWLTDIYNPSAESAFNYISESSVYNPILGALESTSTEIIDQISDLYEETASTVGEIYNKQFDKYFAIVKNIIPPKTVIPVKFHCGELIYITLVSKNDGGFIDITTRLIKHVFKFTDFSLYSARTKITDVIEWNKLTRTATMLNIMVVNTEHEAKYFFAHLPPVLPPPIPSTPLIPKTIPLDSISLTLPHLPSLKPVVSKPTSSVTVNPFVGKPEPPVIVNPFVGKPEPPPPTIISKGKGKTKLSKKPPSKTKTEPQKMVFVEPPPPLTIQPLEPEYMPIPSYPEGMTGEEWGERYAMLTELLNALPLRDQATHFFTIDDKFKYYVLVNLKEIVEMLSIESQIVLIRAAGDEGIRTNLILYASENRRKTLNNLPNLKTLYEPLTVYAFELILKEISVLCKVSRPKLPIKPKVPFPEEILDHIRWMLNYIGELGTNPILSPLTQNKNQTKHRIRAAFPDYKESDTFLKDIEPTKTLLGEGAFGTVFKFTIKSLKKDVAAKFIRRDTNNNENFDVAASAEWITLQLPAHINILQIYAYFHGTVHLDTFFHKAFVSSFFSKGRGITIDKVCYPGNHYIILSELQSNSFKNYIDKKKSFTWFEILMYTWQLIEGYHAMFEAKLIHNDSKPDNVLIDTVNGMVCVADFGFVKQFNDQGVFTFGKQYVDGKWIIHRTGNYMGMPPEMKVIAKEISDAHAGGRHTLISRPTDVSGYPSWESGIVIFQMIHGTDDARFMEKVNRRIKEMTAARLNPMRTPLDVMMFKDDSFKDALATLIDNMLIRNYTRRISIAKANEAIYDMVVSLINNCLTKYDLFSKKK